MDTRSRKSHKLAKLIITLCVIIPALLLVSIYPKMGESMLERKEYYEKLQEEEDKEAAEYAEDDPEWVIINRFTNYAVEASYFIYAQMLEQISDGAKDYFAVLYDYGWDSDYQFIYDNTSFIATYTLDETKEPIVIKNCDELDAQVGKLIIEYDAYGHMSNISFEGAAAFEEVESFNTLAENSERQYKQNVKAYMNSYDENLDEVQFVPQNLKVEFALNEYSEFVDYYDNYYYVYEGYHRYMEPVQLWAEVGTIWIVLLCICVVVFVAFLLPFFRTLNTGSEKLFSLPLEIMICVAVGTVFAIIGMCIAMANTTMWNIEEVMQYQPSTEILGYQISEEAVYNCLRVIEFVGWALSFLLVYVVASAIRQFVTHPIQYIKNQTLIFKVCRWIKKKCVGMYNYVTDIDINNNMEKSIFKIVIANFLIVTLLCCLWFGGAVGAIIYSVLLYVLLRKYGQKIQAQYHSILHATQQMADGDLKISLDEELGVFEPIGKSLEYVQVGFQKAVIEEAKSQNMKTELITNVSHDLKTPLTAIITYVDLLKNENITEEERKSYIATLDQKSQRLKVLIEDLFEVSKAHSGNVKMNFMSIDVVSLLKQVRSEMSEQIENSELQFRWSFPEEKVILQLDGQRTYRVFENLVNNILKYAMPYSRVYIDVIQTDQQVQIRFRNVSAMELNVDTEKLTDRFVRGDSARKSEGSGLGLAIAKSFVELQHGDLKIEVDGDLFKVLLTFKR